MDTTVFVWAILVLSMFRVGIRMVWLSGYDQVKFTRRQIAGQAVFNMLLVAWAAVHLLGR